MPGDYPYRKNKAVITDTISHNDKLREQKARDASIAMAEASSLVAGYLRKKDEKGGVSLEKYLGKQRVEQLKGYK